MSHIARLGGRTAGAGALGASKSSPKCGRRERRNQRLAVQSIGSDVASQWAGDITTSPTVQLIMEQASSHIDTHAASNIVSQLAGVLADAGGHLHLNHPLNDLEGAFQTVAGMQAPAEYAGAAAGSTANPEVLMSAATSMLQGGALSPEGLQGLGLWASEKLAVVQSIDPESYRTMHSVLESLLVGTQDAVSHQVAPELVASWTNALVLGVQQLVTSLHTPEAAGVSIEGLLAAQEAMQTALTQATAGSAGLVARGAAAGEMPAGLNGLLQIVLAMTAMVVASVPKNRNQEAKLAEMDAKGERLTVPRRYDLPALHPVLVLRRNSEVVSKLSTFVLAILADWKTGRWESNMPMRAKQLRRAAETLGPAYVKIAQMLSTRVDFMPPAYLDELAALQDNVKPFSTMEARQVLEDGIKRPVDSVFEWLSEEPIAAASLGQVYRGKMRYEWGGKEVAVKVQRPGALESVSLDIFIMRRAVTLFSQIPTMSDSWAEVMDDWATRFFMEMDYLAEAQNTMLFKKNLESLDGVTVATVYPELTSREVIVTEWIEGERLAETAAEDVHALCHALLNCYLIQLLETGILHADPHPGNLMRTPDGKVVILDFGLITEVTEEQQVALVEYIAHLTCEDWEAVSHDLVSLGFMPEGMPADAVQVVAPIMEKILIFISPANIVQVDPEWSIVKECMPYLSRRLLTDNNPRMKAALRKLLYGNGTRLDVNRLQKMMSSMSTFSTAAAKSGRLASGPTFSAAGSGMGEPLLLGSGDAAGLLSAADEGPVVSDSMKEVLKVVFSKDGSYAQEILVEEAVVAIDAMSRQGMGEALKLITGSASAMATLRGMESLGPLRAFLLPPPVPLEMLTAFQPAVRLSNDDHAALSTIRALLDMMAPAGGSGMGGQNGAMMYGATRAMRAGQDIAPILPELMPGLQSTAEMFVRQLLRRMALRLAADLDQSQSSTSGSSSYSSTGQASTPYSQTAGAVASQ
ncbi:ABC1 family-domain-containing protein [Dunaliella salina]|uniref:ABC1 family-domain-containing protein n=1 Tax=Dunaliella salina TaxID=3046 RepID=A0ABQ7FZW2_DUNSA|nr:ABC1 family-domain-containing protein [Dunaliella salina]|eukprot:KAF5827894.1 ABC1 family-domain-containing protein [Dunaliella salina]